MGDLSGQITIERWWCYLGAALFLSLFVRACHSLLRAFKVYHTHVPSISYWGAVWQCFRGYPDLGFKIHADYWYTFILGFAELAFYPVLIKAAAWTAIGAWVGLKSVAQWKVWADDRATFNLFLIGTVGNLILAFALAPMVGVTPTAANPNITIQYSVDFSRLGVDPLTPLPAAIPSSN